MGNRLSIEAPKLARNLRDDRCVLVLGPHFSMSDDIHPLIDQVHKQYIDGESDISFYPEDGLFNIKEELHRIDLCEEIKDVFRRGERDLKGQEIDPANKLHDLYEKISQIPFHMIISTSPDHQLSTAFDKLSIFHNTAFFNLRDPESADKFIPVPDKACPLIYNLMGSVKDFDSMVVTYDDLQQYLERIFSNIPPNVKNTLEKATSMIFIGFKFRRWHQNLIIQLLTLKNKRNYGIIMPRDDIDNAFFDRDITFYRERFSFEFLNEDMDHFEGTIGLVNELKEAYQILVEEEQIVPLRELNNKELHHEHELDFFRQKMEFYFQQKHLHGLAADTIKKRAEATEISDLHNLLSVIYATFKEEGYFDQVKWNQALVQLIDAEKDIIGN